MKQTNNRECAKRFNMKQTVKTTINFFNMEQIC